MGPLFYRTSPVLGLLFWLRANVIANRIRVRVADHKLAAKDLLELLTDYQVASGRLVIPVVRILAALLALAAAPAHHSFVILRIVRRVHPIPAVRKG